MAKTIDCLFIGHNEIDFSRYEKNVRSMGTHSGAYKDLNLNFIQYHHQPYSITEIFNLFYGAPGSPGEGSRPLSTGETFSNAVAYLGTYLQRRGFTFDYVNSFQDDKEELAEKLREENILAVAVITTLYVSVIPILEIKDFIKKHNRSAKIIVGGPFIATQVRSQRPIELEYLFKTTIGADIYVNSSQGEAALVNILHALKNNLPLDGIDNIYYKTDQGYLSTAGSPENNSISENMVKWDLFRGKLNGIVNVRTSISCPFSCAFCGFPEHAGKFQAAETAAVMRELISLDQMESVQVVNFIDDTFNIPQNRFKDLLKEMIKSEFKFRWISNFRCQFADIEMVELMKESGCEGVFLGIESGSDQILKHMNKGAVVEKYLKGIALLKDHEIATMGSFIVGFPPETPETVEETVRFIEKSGLDFYRAQLWYCEPITPIWRKRKEYNLEGQSFEWSHNTMDSKTASRFVDDIFLKIDKAVWVPQYNFGFDKIWFLKQRGMNLKQIKRFLSAFNNGIKQKLANPSREEIGMEVVEQLRDALGINKSDDNAVDEEKKVIDAEQVQFNF